MEVLGRIENGIESISSSSVSPTSFVSLCSNGTVSLWDTRLKNPRYATIERPRFNQSGEPAEVLFAEDRWSALVAWGRSLVREDTRMLRAEAFYHHDCEIASFLSGKQPIGEASVLFVDENGSAVPFSIATTSPTLKVPHRIYESCISLEQENDRFGSLTNLCCGVEQATGPDGRRLLCILGMDGMGTLTPSSLFSSKFQLDLSMQMSGQVVNPPLPTCCRALSGRVAVGRADGTYSILDIDEDCCGLVEELIAPGHESSGLCSVEWVGERGAERLLTVSLSGDITAWDVQGYLQTPADEVMDDLPPVCSAYAVRESLGVKKSIINCAAAVNEATMLFGDTLGHSLLCNLEMV